MDLETFRCAHRRIRRFLHKTPLLPSEELSRRLNCKFNVYLKCENFQVTRSFKPRGALNAMIQNPQRLRGFVCRSSGNFGQGMAFAGQKLGISVTVVMAENAAKVKVDNARRLGANVVQVGTTHQEGYRKVKELEQEGAGAAISSFDDPDVIAGQGTVALEVFDELPSLQHFFCPVGGGGLMAGCGAVLKALRPGVEVVAVEPIGAADFFLSFQKRQIESIEQPTTIADGLRTPHVGQYNWPLLIKNTDRVQLVDDDDIIRAMKFLFEQCGMVVEPSGAASLAGLLKTDPSTLAGDIVCVISGGNVDRDHFLRWMNETPWANC
ncbi:MAG: threonine/serine dehydratase [Waddliaceae bacterium]